MSELYYQSLSELTLALQSKALSVTEVVTVCLNRIKTLEPKLGALLTLNEEAALQEAQALDAAGPDKSKPLWGVPVTIKDIILTKGLKTTCASKMLANFVPPYDAFVTEKIRQSGAIILGKANLDEFAMGSTTENSSFHPAHNPWNLNCVPGGSSGGSAVAVASGECFASLGTDTGGSIRQPAALCGCVGLKPTYGRVSRYGVIAYGSSLDQVGPMARSVEDVARVLQVIAGHDGRDATSDTRPVPDYLAQLKSLPSLDGVRLGIPKEFFGEGLSPDVSNLCHQALKACEEDGAILVPVSLPHTHAAIATYYIIAMAEASSNLARYDGVRYGYRSQETSDLQELYVNSRTEGLGQEVKRRIMLGAFVLSSGYYDAYFRRAAQVRRIIRDEYVAALNECDALFCPVSPLTAWPIGSHADDPLAMYLMDAYTLSLNLAGLPGLSLPVGLSSEGLPVGMQLIGQAFVEEELLKIGYRLEQILPSIGHPQI
ncbi:MAG: Asp-tRNA(Asn)/Glu-tRNA(Gln) amidotransferase subunit GatA [Desulfovibrionaceae bacterium]|nr:Asp-tRNA(Asn)/Glu-tRNA(Gln) amidotransferase subunit GatA [Desulfovibrionaceae bacterium]